MHPREIVRCSVETLDLPLAVPFETALGRRTEAHNLLVAIELADGARGIAEAAPAPHVTGEDQDTARAALSAFLPGLVGRDAARCREHSEAFDDAYPHLPAARAALEAALLDADCRRLGLPLYRFFGGARREIVSDITVPIVSPDEAARAAAAAVREGFEDLKIKVGSGDEDFERVVAVAQAAPSARIRLDGNQGLAPDEAVALMERVQAAGVAVTLYEQPVSRDDLDGLRFVREHVSVPVAADESVLTPDDARRAIAAGAVDVINIKLAKSGIYGALEIVDICHEEGVRLMLGCMLETRIGISVAAHLAAGLGAFQFIDLDGHLMTGDTHAAGGFEQTGGRMRLLDAPGHGAGTAA